MMKTFLTISLVLFLCVSCTSGNAPPTEEQAPPTEEEAPAATGEVQTFEGKGIVEAFDEASVTIAHEDIPGFMEAMTMEFYVEDYSLLEGLEVGTEVEFTVVVREDGTYYIDSIREVQQ